jgi:hypothetical protein
MADHSVGVRVQGMSPQDQVLVLARLAETRSSDSSFSPKEIGDLYLQAALPAPAKVANAISALGRKGLVTPGTRCGRWRLTPIGRNHSIELMSQMDLAALAAETAAVMGPTLGTALHSVIPPLLAPPTLIPRLQRFLEEHPFEHNVFGMTRFPAAQDKGEPADPVGPALDVAREVCQQHGLEFHLASDRAIDDDLWTNVAAHMWASRYGTAFFEDRRDRGMNYNLTIEVGGMLVTGRRCSLLKDTSIERMPTDLVGRIYKEVDLSKIESVCNILHAWIRDDLGLGACSECPPQ